MSIEIANESGVAVDETVLVDLARFAMGSLRVHQQAELSVVLVERETMTDLHEQWMDLPGPTDVMAFPMDELEAGSHGKPDSAAAGPGMLGDIVLCPDFAREQAKRAGHGLSEELHLLTVHGLLHLLGYDHGEPAEEQEMFALQNRLLADYRESVSAEAARLRQDSADGKLLGTVGLGGSGEPDAGDAHSGRTGPGDSGPAGPR